MPEGITGASARHGADLPDGLADLSDPPAVLFVMGTWPTHPKVAIVGARAATPYGCTFAHRLAGDLARLGFAVVSGLARGIDAAAHRGALDAGGVTVAVLPGSLDRVTPLSHAELAHRVLGQGALAAEWEAGVPASRGLFLRRNRLIAAVAKATVVVEAAERSGALATAAVARRLGRPVLAVPGDVDRPSSRGCLGLLREGARVCADAGDVLAAMEVGPWIADAARGATRPREAREPSSTTGGLGDGARVAAALDFEARGLDGVASRSGVTPERTLAALLELEWAGIAEKHPGPRWTARRVTRA
jgi:DNA processing protein